MGRPKKTAANVASVNVSAKIYPAEKDALDRLVALRGAKLRESGTSDATFAGWLRETIRAQAKDVGVPVVDAQPDPPKPKPKARK